MSQHQQSDADTVPHLQPGPLTAELPQALPGLTNPLAMERLLPDPMRPAISGDIVAFDLDGLKAQLPHRAVAVSALRYRERSDGSWAMIDRQQVGDATGELVYALGLGPIAGEDADEARGMGFIAMVVGGRGADEQVIRVVPIGTTRFGEGLDLLRISKDQRVLALRVSNTGDVRAAVRHGDGHISTIGRSPSDATPVVGEVLGFDGMDSASWAVGFFSAAEPFCQGFGCMVSGQPMDGLAIGVSGQLPAGLEARCEGTDLGKEGLVVATVTEVVVGADTPVEMARCAALPDSETLARCVRDGGTLRMAASHDAHRAHNVVVAVACSGTLGEGESAVFTSDLTSESGWRAVIKTDRGQLPSATPERQDDACEVLRIAANDSHTGPFVVDVPMNDCAEPATLQMRGLPEAMVSTNRNDAVALRADGFVPARGLVFDIRAPGRASCELGGEGENAPLCVDAWTNGARLIRGAASFAAGDGRTWIVTRLGAVAKLSRDALEPRVRLSEGQTVLVGLAASGAMLAAPVALASDCGDWALAGDDMLVGVCRDGLRALRIDVAQSSKTDASNHLTVKEIGAWPILNPKAGTGNASFACGQEGQSRPDSLPCPRLTVAEGSNTDASIYVHYVASSSENAMVNALRFDPARTPNGTVVGFQTAALTGVGLSAGAKTTLSEVVTASFDDRLYTVLAIHEGPTSLHKVTRTAIITFNAATDREMTVDTAIRHTVPARGANAVTPVGIATVGFKRDGSPRRALVGIMTDNSASQPDPETGAERNGAADLDTIAITSLDACDDESPIACHWVASQVTSPFVAMTRGVGVAMPAEAVLGQRTQLVDTNGDGLTDIVIGVSADDRVRVSARRPQVLRADGRGGFAEALSAPAELWSMPVDFARHDACDAPVVVGNEGLAMFGVDPWDLALCTGAADDVADSNH